MSHTHTHRHVPVYVFVHLHDTSMLSFQIIPPVFSVFPVEEANVVFRRLSHCEIDGRAVLRVCSEADSLVGNASSSVFASSSADRITPNSPTAEEPMSCISPDSADVSTAVGGNRFFLPHADADELDPPTSPTRPAMDADRHVD